MSFLKKLLKLYDKYKWVYDAYKDRKKEDNKSALPIPDEPRAPLPESPRHTKDSIPFSEFGGFSRAPGHEDVPATIKVFSANRHELRFDDNRHGVVEEWIIASSNGKNLEGKILINTKTIKASGFWASIQKAFSDKAASHGRSTNWNKHAGWPGYFVIVGVYEGRRRSYNRSAILKVD